MSWHVKAGYPRNYHLQYMIYLRFHHHWSGEIPLFSFICMGALVVSMLRNQWLWATTVCRQKNDQYDKPMPSAMLAFSSKSTTKTFERVTKQIESINQVSTGEGSIVWKDDIRKLKMLEAIRMQLRCLCVCVLF